MATPRRASIAFLQIHRRRGVAGIRELPGETVTNVTRKLELEYARERSFRSELIPA